MADTPNAPPNRRRALGVAASVRGSVALVCALALAGCGRDGASSAIHEPPAAEAPGDAGLAPGISLLVDAVRDVEVRVAPAVDTRLRGPMTDALGRLRAALAVGDSVRAARALGEVRHLLARHAAAPEHPEEADAVDVAAIELVADLVADLVARERAGAEATHTLPR